MHDELGNTLELGNHSVQYYWALPIHIHLLRVQGQITQSCVLNLVKSRPIQDNCLEI